MSCRTRGPYHRRCAARSVGVVEGCAHPALRVALEHATEGELDDEVLAEAERAAAAS